MIIGGSMEHLTEEDKKKKKIFTTCLVSFYIVCAVFFVIGGLYWWDSKETFYLTASKVAMVVDGNYQIGMYGKTEEKKHSSYEYTSSNTNIATVDKLGNVQAVSEGETSITVKSKYSSKKHVLDIIVQGDEVYSVEFENEIIHLNVGKETSLPAIINGDPDFQMGLIWESKNEEIATINREGTIKAIAPGATYIKVTVEGTNVSTMAKIIVDEELNDSDSSTPTTPPTESVPTPPIVNSDYDEDEEVNKTVHVTGVYASVAKDSLKVGEKTKLAYEIRPHNADNKNVTFASNNTKVAKIDKNGNITALSPGQADISVRTKDGNKTFFVTIYVSASNVPVNSVTLNKRETTLVVGSKETLIATISPASATNKSLSWSSSNPSVATVSKNGVLEAKQAGTTTITVTTKDGGKQASATVTVKNKVVAVKGVSLDKTSMNLNLGSTYHLTATINPSNATNQNITWSTSNSKVVSVDLAGNIKAVSSGTATIKVKTSDGNYEADCKVTVPAIKITKLTLNANKIQLVKGKTYQIKASITPSNATNKSLKYTSDNTGVATVNSSGKITAKGLGTATIKVAATDGSSKTATMTVVVAASGNMIDIRNQKYTKYYTDVINYMYATSTSSKHIQNFAIYNIGKSSETAYFSTVESGTSSDISTAEKKAQLNRTIIFKVPKSVIGSPKSAKRSVMYLKNSGHGQAFDLEKDGTMWTNAYGLAPTKSGDTWWGGSEGVMRIKFKANEKDAAFSPLTSMKITDSKGNAYTSFNISIDEANNLIALRKGTRVLVYRLSELKKAKGTYKYNKTPATLVYNFKLASTLTTYSDGSTISKQGDSLHNGYYYLYRGAPGKASYVEVFNLLGELQYTKKLSISTANSREAEGLKIYNEHIYIGSTHTKSGVKGKLFDVGYFK